jgi:hypothetical protein
VGASAWNYFVPYQADISTALQRLRDEVFAKGEHLSGIGISRPDMEAALKACGGDMESTLKEFSARASDPNLPSQVQNKFATLVEQLRQLDNSKASLPKPRTIEELLERQGDSGTHSILDIVRVSPASEFGAVSPLPTSRLIEIFGSDKPSRTQIENVYEEGALNEYTSERWRGIYIVAYASELPHEIFFAGCSGD